MLVHRGIPENAPGATVLTIGNFDGVHRGHQALLERLREAARRFALPAAVLTFEPHPREYFAPEGAPPRLTSLREKIELLGACGVDRLHVCRFDARFAAHTADDFVQQVLVRGLGVRHLIIGDDFRFGKGREGDFAMLQRCGGERRFVVEAMHTVDIQGERVSSSAVREALAAGDLEHAGRLLGRPYSLSGKVGHGDRLGRKIGFPTANIHLRRRALPLTGVYAVRVHGLGATLSGVANIGVRPTVAREPRPRLEVHLFDFAGDLYGAHLRVSFVKKLRDEARFESLDALTAQIARDAELGRRHFASLDPS
jgi:riboflavin kinase/FMN adenylyltransferase